MPMLRKKWIKYNRNLRRINIIQSNYTKLLLTIVLHMFFLCYTMETPRVRVTALEGKKQNKTKHIGRLLQ